MDNENNTPLISIVIVNYKVPHEICQLLRSVQEALLYNRTEIIVVDNASNDNSRDMVMTAFPAVQWISLKNNIGFGKACNVGAQKAQGTYLLFINPDTLVSSNTLQVSYEFMESHPEVGIMGPKILKPDGSFQPHCRRTFPTPFSGFVYLFGLSRIFPKSKRLNKYNLPYLSSEISMEVDAVSGSFMFMRRELFYDLDGFDKEFFMYGEDLDLCARVREKGYKVWYNPATQIIHFKGKSCAKKMIRTRLAFYEAMILFTKKYRHTYGGYLPGWLLTLGILVRAGLNIGAILLKSSVACLIDLVFINMIHGAVLAIRFQTTTVTNPYTVENIPHILLMHGLLTACFLLTNAYRGVYSSERYSVKNTFFSGIIASIIFISMAFFLRFIAFSRIAFSLSSLLISLSLTGWRMFLPGTVTWLKRRVFSTGKVIVVGNDTITTALIRNLEEDKTAHLCGVVWPSKDSVPGEFEGYPVLGSIDTIVNVLQSQCPDLLLIATTESWYSAVIEALGVLHHKKMTIQWVPHEIFKQPADRIPQEIPLVDFSV